MAETITSYIGLDLGDKYSELCELDARGEVVEKRRIRTSGAGIRKAFAQRPRARADRGHVENTLF